MYWIKVETNIEKKNPKQPVINRKGFQNLSAKLFAINICLCSFAKTAIERKMNVKKEM